MRAQIVAMLAALLAQPSPAPFCPGSPARVMHAGASLTAHFPHSCDTVWGEVSARLRGAGGWEDPHCQPGKCSPPGIYMIERTMPAGGSTKSPSAPSTLWLNRTTAGAGSYTDRLELKFAVAGSGCQLDACSESQVTSYADFSTNYCNLHDLYCGAAECVPLPLPASSAAGRPSSELGCLGPVAAPTRNRSCSTRRWTSRCAPAPRTTRLPVPRARAAPPCFPPVPSRHSPSPLPSPSLSHSARVGTRDNAPWLHAQGGEVPAGAAVGVRPVQGPGLRGLS